MFNSVYFGLFSWAAAASAASFVVTTTNDAGPGSLRQAIEDANLAPGRDNVILTNLTGTISVSSTLPTLQGTSLIGPGPHKLTLHSWAVLMVEGPAGSTISGLRITGGGINNAGTLVIAECEFTYARAGYFGSPAVGAIHNAGTLTIRSSSFFDNMIQGSCITFGPWQGTCTRALGGAIYNSTGRVSIVNSTFSRNRAIGYTSGFYRAEAAGGAIFNSQGTITLSHCTLADNFATDYWPTMGGGVTLFNTIVVGSEYAGLTVSNGNLFAATLELAGLGPLQDNGGLTLTHAPVNGSSALEAGASGNLVFTDQRNVPRPQGLNVDIGAVELVWPADMILVRAEVNGRGRVLRNPDLSAFPSNAVATLTAFPDEDYVFSGWSGDIVASSNPLVITVNRNTSVVASFEYSPATVTNAAGATNFVANTNEWGPGSFRQAVRDAMASGGGVIRFSNVTGTIALPLGLPTLTANTRIYGPGPTNLILNFTNRAEGLYVAAGVTSVLSGLTIDSAHSTNRPGGAIFNAGDLRLNRVHIRNCSSTTNGGAVFNSGTLRASACVFGQNQALSGGAIHNLGTIALISCVFTQNSCLREGTSGYFLSDYAGGGAFQHAAGEAIIENCIFSGNRALGGITRPGSLGEISGEAGIGGAICIATGKVTLLNTLICSNATRGSGGSGGQVGGGGGSAFGTGVFVGAGTLDLAGCSIWGNVGVAGDAPWASRFFASGGAAWGGGLFTDRGSVFAANCTFSGNEVRSGSSGGGGFGGMPGWGQDGAGGGLGCYRGMIVLTNCTITANRAFGGTNAGPFGTNAGRGLGGGIYIHASGYTGTVATISTILSGNYGATRGTTGIVSDDSSGPLSSLGHNLLGVASRVLNFSSSDIVGLDPKLGPLQDNGGPAPTHALRAGSPAIDAGAAVGLAVDQRGEPRTVDNPAVSNREAGTGTDIGAFEVDHNLRMTSARRLESNMLVRFTSVSDKTYGVEFKEEVSDNEWLRLLIQVQGSGGIVTATDVGAAGHPRRFYRALENPR